MRCLPLALLVPCLLLVGDAARGQGGFVIDLADQDVDEQFELHRTDFKTGTSVKVSGDLVAGGDVLADD